MTTTPQKRGLKRSAKRLNEGGIACFEVLGLESDRELIRSLAKRLAANDANSDRIRVSVHRTLSGGEPQKGGILRALLRSPLVGADLDLSRPPTLDRDVHL